MGFVSWVQFLSLLQRKTVTSKCRSRVILSGLGSCFICVTPRVYISVMYLFHFFFFHSFLAKESKVGTTEFRTKQYLEYVTSPSCGLCNNCDFIFHTQTCLSQLLGLPLRPSQMVQSRLLNRLLHPHCIPTQTVAVGEAPHHCLPVKVSRVLAQDVSCHIKDRIV